MAPAPRQLEELLCMEAAGALQLQPELQFLEDLVARVLMGSYLVAEVAIWETAPPAESASPSFKALNLKISNARTL